MPAPPAAPSGPGGGLSGGGRSLQSRPAGRRGPAGRGVRPGTVRPLAGPADRRPGGCGRFCPAGGADDRGGRPHPAIRLFGGTGPGSGLYPHRHRPQRRRQSGNSVAPSGAGGGAPRTGRDSAPAGEAHPAPAGRLPAGDRGVSDRARHTPCGGQHQHRRRLRPQPPAASGHSHFTRAQSPSQRAHRPDHGLSALGQRLSQRPGPGGLRAGQMDAGGSGPPGGGHRQAAGGPGPPRGPAPAGADGPGKYRLLRRPPAGPGGAGPERLSLGRDFPAPWAGGPENLRGPAHHHPGPSPGALLPRPPGLGGGNAPRGNPLAVPLPGRALSQAGGPAAWGRLSGQNRPGGRSPSAAPADRGHPGPARAGHKDSKKAPCRRPHPPP